MKEQSRVENSLTTSWIGRPVLCLESAASTNDYVKTHGSSLSRGAAVYTLRQTGGRGRRGKVWDDGGGKSVALSVLIKGLPLRVMAELSLYCGLAAADGLTALTGRDCAVKWPNDILMRGKKLVGILCESFSLNDEMAAVAGIGVNLYETSADFIQRGLPGAGSLLSETGVRYEPEEVISTILNCLEQIILSCEADGFSSVRERYESRCMNIGREVCVQYENSRRTGIATGIGVGGGLIVESGGEIITVRSGEASIRGPE